MMKKIAFSIGSLLLAALSQSSTGWAQDQAEGKKLYASYCSSCHGEQGKGDGMAARSLPIKPKDHTDGATMNRLTDQNLADTISKGGAAVGKSSFMPAWGGVLKDNQLQDLLAYLRSIANPPQQSGK